MGKTINVKNSYMAKITEEDGAIKFGVPERVLGIQKASRVPTAATGEQYEEGKLAVNIALVSGYSIAFDISNLPSEWRAWVNGLNYSDGIETDDGLCKPNPFSLGWEIEKADGTSQLIWFYYCTAAPIEDSDEQSEKDIKVSNDTINITAFKREEFDNRAYTKIDTGNESITKEMISNFFKKVQTDRNISAPEA